MTYEEQYELQKNQLKLADCPQKASKEDYFFPDIKDAVNLMNHVTSGEAFLWQEVINGIPIVIDSWGSFITNDVLQLFVAVDNRDGIINTSSSVSNGDCGSGHQIYPADVKVLSRQRYEYVNNAFKVWPSKHSRFFAQLQLALKNLSLQASVVQTVSNPLDQTLITILNRFRDSNYNGFLFELLTCINYKLHMAIRIDPNKVIPENLEIWNDYVNKFPIRYDSNKCQEMISDTWSAEINNRELEFLAYVSNTGVLADFTMFGFEKVQGTKSHTAALASNYTERILEFTTAMSKVWAHLQLSDAIPQPEPIEVKQVEIPSWILDSISPVCKIVKYLNTNFQVTCGLSPEVIEFCKSL
jgi:hypothetical protein